MSGADSRESSVHPLGFRFIAFIASIASIAWIGFVGFIEFFLINDSTTQPFNYIRVNQCLILNFSPSPQREQSSQRRDLVYKRGDFTPSLQRLTAAANFLWCGKGFSVN